MCVDLRFASLMLLVACGGLADGEYNGVPLITLEGQVIVDSSIDLDVDVGVALLWSDSLEPNTGSQSVVVKTEFPARYTIDIFRPPPASSQLALFGQEELRAAVAEVILFQDVDHDGRWGGEREPIVGGSFGMALLWVAPGDERSGQLEWTPEQEGFQLVDVLAPSACFGFDQTILEPRQDTRMDLQAGWFWQETQFDWDCDGLPEWQDTGEDWFLEECPPELQSECDFYGSLAADQPELLSDFAQNIQSDPFLVDCLDATCPEVMDALWAAL